MKCLSLCDFSRVISRGSLNNGFYYFNFMEIDMPKDLNNRSQIPNLINDASFASMLSMSTSWIRGERSKRLKGKDHTLEIDPVMIGSSPRYLISDVEAFIASLVSANKRGDV
jgi:hypothetical protein